MDTTRQRNYGVSALRAVQDETPVLSSDDLQERGNALVAEARVATMQAVHDSMQPQFLQRTPLSVVQLRRWRDDARDAAREWQKVNALLTEVLAEIDKTRGVKR